MYPDLCGRTAAVVLSMSIAALPQVVHAQEARKPFDIAAGPALNSVVEFARQAGINVLASGEVLAGIDTPAVRGTFTVTEALDKLLSRTGLTSRVNASGAIFILGPDRTSKGDKTVTGHIPMQRRATCCAVMLALGGASAAYAQTAPDGVAAPDGAMKQEETATVVVTGMRASLQSARNRKRDNDAISDSIVADDIGKLPDQNIAEAAQRIPGIQVGRSKGEGANIQIRGLGQNKVVLNGLEMFGAGEYNGRSFDLEDLPADVLAGIDVNKSSSANEIEGGLGGYVNIRTRQPFDFKGRAATVSAKATNYRMAGGAGDKTRGQASVLFSDRWKTGVGDMGLLLNAAHTESVFGLAENQVERTEMIPDYAGSGKGVTVPIGRFTGNAHHGDRNRDTLIASYQWRVSPGLSFFANYIGIDYLLRNNFQTARFYHGTPTSAYTTWGDTNSDGSDNLKSGTFTNNSLTDTSVIGDEHRKSQLFDVGGRWSNGGPLTVNARLAHNETAVVNTLFEWGISAKVPTMTMTMNDGAPTGLSVSGIDLNNLANYHPNYLLAIHLDGKQRNTAATFDANYKFDGGILSSIDFGLRANDYTRHSFGFVNFYCIDGCNSSRTLATVDPALLHQVPARESVNVGPYWTYTTAAVRGQSALRTLYGLPASEQNTQDQDQLNREKTLAFYLKANLEFAIAGKPVTGNLGLRAIETKLHGESYGANAAGTLELQSRDSKRHDMLPSFNGNIALSDDLNLRLGASKTLAPVNFGFMAAATTITNQVQHDARAGNPDLQPFTSRNLDVSLEHYFGRNGMAFLGAFHKKVDGFIQTVAEQRVINGETYNVSTFKSSGTSKIQGVEAGFQQFFDMLPAPFNGLGLQANYTYVDSKAASALAGKTVPLEGLSKNSYNLIGMYEKGRFKARLAYNWRDGFVVSTSSSGAQGVPIYAKELGTLDFSIGYDVTRQLSIVVDGVNILGAATETYYGNSHSQANYQPLNKRYGIQARYSF
ncbi:TonB-dependent receptor [Telluria mixta]|uniref:TonB-dependent receptor n=1 Tax=Telluria mixta TaxID=34071 RepID=A0ABT2BU53_9BURK|nr:TonB-dependent receptor [Telluria mixta]MCS0628171.1 TonB-dependent receptor [Telluria mixta]WEM99385.1 TonB-dependent receptor [Telluria mixta]